ncbi:lysophospholipase [Brevibacillus ruminantium]|uniref:Lysophospholipase n=1 Tax=Brevibacillus ruminantium TaxID=2950604 RepID=A0ABY4WL54_9BACL|nr:alpha/beta hydrolase [Brevibacillus ruminantium]USG67501.1 lysophospholipase [Brevibacillus ruminantium]
MDWYSHKWPVEQPRASVVLIHGAGEHHGRYTHVAEALRENGVEVISGDLPGWGRSPGRKGHIEQFSQYLAAVEEWVARTLEQAAGGRPVFLLGHSMGGLVAVRYLQSFDRNGQLAGVILSSPCLRLKIPVAPWKARLAGWLDKSWPTLRMASGITPEMVTRDPQVQKSYEVDPWQYPKVSVRWYQELHRAMEEAWQNQKQLTLPALIMQAGDDELVDADAVERFVAGLPGEVAFRRYPGLRHELLNEPEKEEIMAWIIHWMREHGL